MLGPKTAELLFQDERCQNGDVHQLYWNKGRWSTCGRYWLCRKVCPHEGLSEEVLLSIQMSKTDFKERDVCTRNNTYSSGGYIRNDIHSPALLICRGQR